MDTQLIFKIIEVIVLCIACLIGRYVIPFVKTKVGIEKLNLIQQWLKVFVSAAEVLVSGEKKGAEKLSLVTTWINQKSKELGYELTEEQIRALIEEAVAEMNREA